jgi:hypothetical protein
MIPMMVQVAGGGAKNNDCEISTGWTSLETPLCSSGTLHHVPKKNDENDDRSASTPDIGGSIQDINFICCLPLQSSSVNHHQQHPYYRKVRRHL